MTLAFATLPCPDSPLSRLDPRWKLAALVLAGGAAAALRTVPAALLALLGAWILAALARLPPRWYLARVGAAAVLVVPLVVLLPLLVRDEEPLARLGPFAVSRPGLRLGLLVGAKALTVFTLVLVLLATAPLDATLRAAHALRVPGLVIQLAALAYRYLFLLAAELRRLRQALRVRGYRNRASWHCYRTLGHVAGTLLVHSYERAERVGQAMRCRGFDGRFRALADFRTARADVAAFALIAGAAGGLLLWEVLRPV